MKVKRIQVEKSDVGKYKEDKRIEKNEWTNPGTVGIVGRGQTHWKGPFRARAILILVVGTVPNKH